MKSSNEIREAFLSFFEKHGHQRVSSSSLVPANDKTLLFTNAGMVPFKDVFLGNEKRPYSRATSSQRCVRAGGKHNDLENVGYTARHHTFFEMLGNFSFGDYFKREAIKYSWEFLTKVLKIPADKLWVTIYEEDNEAADIWLNEMKVDPKKFGRIGAKDNFWSMGDTGPCGPCSEIFYDHGPDIPGGPPGSKEEDGDRYIEIWNLVFMQYDRSSDGKMNPLPKPSVDTGMGLERLAAVLQGVHSNYEIDLFKNLIKATAKATGVKVSDNKSLNVIADHIRSCAFLAVDGVVPSNKGRGSVLRSIIRRAARHGFDLGMSKPFFYTLVDPLCQEMGAAFPELVKNRDQVIKVLKTEELQFAKTLAQGMKLLDAYIGTLQGQVIDGKFAFELYDTHGFPIDMTADKAREHNLTVDRQGYQNAMQAQQQRGRDHGTFKIDYTDRIKVDSKTEFSGYQHLNEAVKVLALYCDGESVKALKQGQQGVVILDRSPFYAESGGQVGDAGMLSTGSNHFQVMDTQKQGESTFLHIGEVKQGTLKVNQKINAAVDAKSRAAIELNHSATHLLHAALRQVLGDHVSQKGSLVNAERLRFDFANPEPVSADQITEIETLVNAQIRLNSAVETKVMDFDSAVKAGAMALFGEKYADEVRVLKIGDFSTELCGGTHVGRAGDIGLFKVTTETGTAAGIRRIEAITGAAAWAAVGAMEKDLQHIASLLKTSPDKVGEKLSQVLAQNKKLEKALEQFKSKLASNQGSDLADGAIDIKGVKVLAAQMEGADAKSLRETVDQLKNKLGSAAVVLASVNNGKISLVAGVTKDQTKKIKAGDLVNIVAMKVGGKGGGRPDMAQAGGDNPAALLDALRAVPDWVTEKLG